MGKFSKKRKRRSLRDFGTADLHFPPKGMPGLTIIDSISRYRWYMDIDTLTVLREVLMYLFVTDDSEDAKYLLCCLDVNLEKAIWDLDPKNIGEFDHECESERRALFADCGPDETAVHVVGGSLDG